MFKFLRYLQQPNNSKHWNAKGFDTFKGKRLKLNNYDFCIL